MRKATILLLSTLLFMGCATSKKEIAKFATATDLAEGIKPNFMEAEKEYSKRDYKDRHASIIVYTSKAERRGSQEWAVNDHVEAYTEFCNINGGIFKDFRKENEKKLASLRADPANRYKEESKYFECGPEGRGTRSDDWTKFNPSVCRKLYDTKLDDKGVYAKYGRPADYACIKEKSVLFMGNIRNYSSHAVITVIEGNKGLLPISELENMDVGE